ncbi:mycodextranase [Virgisporangium aliadipatigenens]|uniref:Mycodextranase n=1 Tax=Virgisporangium aliadipatigenens TaxID=741659 RepID=A0A8J4DMZ1_9ACTN|nr:discoidin domain-containing protein [Virgisporangium aliadipatigenens]GIJ43869.1 mycodextranase [Virgisporangium aliadipatigenens]
MSRRTMAVTGLAATLVVAAGAVAFLAVQAPPARAAGLSPFDIQGRGATVPFVEQEAEEVPHTGTKIGPDRYYGTLPSEASGREAVTLDAVGEYVEFTLTAPANAMTFRYSLPDGPGGVGRDASIDVRVNGSVLRSVPVTSKYGWYYGAYPFTNTPGLNPHHFYDEARTMFGSTLAQGTKVRLQVSSTAQSPTFTIDLADFEAVPDAKPKPANAIDVVADFGADPGGGSADNTARFQAAVDAGRAQGRPVYVPRGNYTLWDHVVVDGVTLQGAGPWYSVLGGRHPTERNRAAGIYGKYVSGGGYKGGIRPHEANGPSRNVTVKDLAVIGDVQERVDDDQVNAFGGAMSNSVIDNVWMQHTKVGAWMDGPMDGLTIRNSRILDQTADGVNFHWGVTNSTVTNTFVRNTGDDALAMWADTVPNVNNSFTFNTIGVTILANHLVTYGGRDIRITDNVTADSVTNGGGIHVANRYTNVRGASGVQGTVTVARNTLIRNGNSDYNWNFGVGAIWFSGLNEAITQATINVTDTDILDSSYAALHWIEGEVHNVNLTNVRIDGAGTYALQIQEAGSATFTNVRATNIAQPNPIHNCKGSLFRITQGAGNSGWYADPPFCGDWPAPQWNHGPSTPPSSGGPSNPTSPSPSPSNPTNPGGNLAQGRPVTASSTNGSFAAGNAVDGNANTYWESANNSFPQTFTVDLGSSVESGRIELKLPPPSAWQARTQTIEVLGSNDGSNFTRLVAPTGYRFDPATGNTATVAIPSGNRRYLRLAFTGNTGWPAAQLSELGVYRGTSLPTGNLAAGRPVTATSATQSYVAGNTVDGNADTYWESANNAFPQSLTVDLGTATGVARVVLKLPPAAAWAARTQTVEVLGSTDGSSYGTVKSAAGYGFDPASGNTVTITFAATTQRYLRLAFTGNTGWPAAQVSEVEAYSS